MIATLLGDYAVAESRGRLVALVGILNGLGVVGGAALLGRLPRVFSDLGYDEFRAGQYTLFVVAGLCLLSALLVGIGLKPGTAVPRAARPPVRHLVRAGVRAGLENPRIAVAYASAFVARGDMVVVGTFLVLWGKVAAVDGGMATAAAIEAGRLPFIISQASALLFAVIALFLLDRFHRMTAMVICMAIATTGYLLLIFVDDPLSPAAIPFFVLLGIGQISAFLGSQALIGKEAPEAERGAVIGTFSGAGALGILITSGVGGQLFDSIDPRAPFFLLGTLNLLVMLAALYTRLRAPAPLAARTAVTDTPC
jgi:MFS family permease